MAERSIWSFAPLHVDLEDERLWRDTEAVRRMAQALLAGHFVQGRDAARGALSAIYWYWRTGGVVLCLSRGGHLLRARAHHRPTARSVSRYPGAHHPWRKGRDHKEHQIAGRENQGVVQVLHDGRLTPLAIRP